MPDPMPDQEKGPEDPRPESASERDPPTEIQITDAVARDVLRIHEESYGRGAQNATARVVGDFVIVVLDQIELLPNEEFLVANGKKDAVAHVRTQYQTAIQAPFRAAVERATGRKVIGFASTNSVEDPRFMVEIFKLG